MSSQSNRSSQPQQPADSGDSGDDDSGRSRYTDLLSGLNAGTWEWEISSGKITVNEGWAEIIGRKSEGVGDLTMDVWQGLMHPADRVGVRDALERHLSGRNSHWDADFRMRHREGRWVWVNGRGRIVELGAKERPSRMAGVILNIDDRKRVEETLRERQLRYDQIEVQSRSFFWEVDLDGRYTFVSPAVRSVLGYRPEELEGKRYFFDLCPSRDREELKRFGLNVLREGEALSEYENRIIARDGTVRWVMSNGISVRDERGEIVGFRGVDTDITDRKAADQGRQLLVSALDAAANSMVITDRDGVIQWVNRAFAEVTGYEPEEALGKTPGELLKSGVHDKAFYQRMWNTLLAGKVWSGEITNRRKDGAHYQEALTITPVSAPDGDIHHFVAIKRDLSEELARERQQLRRQRLESVGTLAGGIAHDLNNALSPILMSIELLRPHLNEVEPHRLLDNIDRATSRCADMVRQILYFAQGAEGSRVSLDMRHLVREIETFIRDTFPKNIELKTDALPDLWRIHGDVTQMRQMFVNFCMNARDAMPDGGFLKIKLRNVEASAPELNTLVDDLNGNRGFVRVSVSDTGTGIAPDVIERIFDPFFTTKGMGKRTGLGLATTHSIIKGHGGFIQVDSSPGQGARFDAYLPVEKEAGGD